MALTGRQIRAGRLLAGLDLDELAAQVREDVSLLAAIEAGAVRNARVLDRLRAVLTDAGIEYGPNGWLRHRDDGATDSEPPAERDYGDALAEAIADLESLDWHCARLLARVLRVCLDSETCAYPLIFDALRTGLHVLICRDMSDGLLISEHVEASSGAPEWPDTLIVRTTTMGGTAVMRALRVLGDDLLDGMTYRPIGPIPPIPPANGWGEWLAEFEDDEDD